MSNGSKIIGLIIITSSMLAGIHVVITGIRGNNPFLIICGLIVLIGILFLSAKLAEKIEELKQGTLKSSKDNPSKPTLPSNTYRETVDAEIAERALMDKIAFKSTNPHL
ncbi:MAG: hypothetical protein WC437_00275 [Patescibacteria group bacterium]